MRSSSSLAPQGRSRQAHGLGECSTRAMRDSSCRSAVVVELPYIADDAEPEAAAAALHD